MPYIKTTWLDRIVQYPRRFLDQSSNQITLTPDPGDVTQAGTAVNAANMNKLEQGVYDATVLAEAALPRTGGTMTGDIAFSDTGEGVSLAGTGLGTNKIVNGNGDGASYTTQNMRIRGFRGMGMSDHNDAVQGYYDFRAGKWDVKDGYYVDGVKTVRTRYHPTTQEPEYTENGVDWYPMAGNLMGYSPISVIGNINSTGTGTWATLVNVTGKGYLQTALVTCSQSSALTTKIKITVDGVVKLEGGAYWSFNGDEPNAVAGMFTAMNIATGFGYNAELGPGLLVGADRQRLPYKFKPWGTIDSNITDPANNWICMLPAEIPFYSSLKVEISTSATATRMDYTVLGGVR